ncbi:glycosyltransferase family 39 protein [Iningainema tapete]|uniref:Glycosyltransferase family 39 protein n=1 Tax=Iningainema tapete BLCC-T55 TaxID=2748662 RepID=A0A8J6XI64_9CYAN|nr:glycosyltransferase family 39 protein [Iningainema tapete]MBD2776424.1 glycosyltransferase family 39 protein [Iningainema tapete BLCC-T55]
MLTTAKRQQVFSQRLLPKWLRLFIIIVLLLGVFFRVCNLERKVYWHDEAYTGLRISGYTKQEFVQNVFDGRTIAVESIKKYQYPSDKSVLDTVKSLAVEDAQHPPLYYVMDRLWVQIFGNSVAASRSLSVVISLLVFPCFYWLCRELFETPLAGWVGIGIISVSPFDVLYAQEARQFSLWTVIILLGSATLLRCIQLGNKQLWGIYAVTVALGLYTFLFSGLVAIAHAIYVFALERRFTKTVRAYLLATSAGFLTFLPWIVVLISNFAQIDDTTASAQKRQSLSNLVSGWITNITNLFGDFWRYEPFFPDLQIPLLRWGRYLIPLILILVVFSFVFLYRRATKVQWLFVFTLTFVPALTLILSDLILGGKLSVRARYIIPCYLGIQLAVTYLLSTQIISAKLASRKFWQFLMVAIISIGVISITISSQAQTWWNKGSHANPQIAQIINNTSKPLLISSNYSLNIGDLLSLSHLLEQKVQMQLVIEPNIPNIPNGFSDVFLYNPSPRFKSELEKIAQLDSVYKKGRLWRVSQ